MWKIDYFKLYINLKRDLMIQLINFLILFFYVFSYALTLRMLVLWFPNINPYKKPTIYLFISTNFYVSLFERILPRITGVDLAPILAMLSISYVIKSLEFLRYLLVIEFFSYF
uniref:Cofactor assembly complex c subunit CCB3 n=1 Tax=Phaeophyceae sp. TaxID=2249243 RepID=A0A8E5BHJ8_9PHAE|nr:cofactor assembly complex c subunit CCB3 [Phaeophyceae sp.]